MRRALSIAAATVVVVTLGAASAGAPGKWTRVTDTNGRNIDEVALAHTGDGVLHVAWRARVGSLREVVKHAAVSRAGVVGPAKAATPAFASVGNPDLVMGSGGRLQLFFGALTGSDPSDGIQAATADAKGLGWSFVGKVSSGRQPGDVGAGVGKDGPPLLAWAAGANMWAHVGPSRKTPILRSDPRPSAATPIPTSPSTRRRGRTFVAFYSNVSGQTGIFVQRLLPSLAPRRLPPGALTAGKSIRPDSRTPIVARAGGGLYVAYCAGFPTCTRVLLWRVGRATPLRVAAGGRIEDVGLARGPGGRLWVFWQDSGKRGLYATRTNAAATRAGAVVPVAPPPGTATVWKLGVEGSLGPLDLFAHASTSGGSLATWHTQVLPGLSLSCSAGKAVTCIVTDAGEPVAGARVKIGGKTLTSSGKGTVTVRLPRGTYTAQATKAGYTGASDKVRVA